MMRGFLFVVIVLLFCAAAVVTVIHAGECERNRGVLLMGAHQMVCLQRGGE